MIASTGPPSRLRRALAFTFPHRRAVIAITLFTLLAAALNAAEPLVLKIIFDGLGDMSGMRALMNGVLILVALALAREGLGALTNWLTWQTRLGIHYALLDTTVGRL